MLTLTGITKTFNPGGADPVTALAGVSLTIEKGDFITLIGSNGAGKSTLLNCLAGVFFPDAGSIILDGRDITALPEYARAAFLGRVFQDPLQGTCASLSIKQNLALAALRGKSRGLSRGVDPRDRDRFRLALGSLSLGLEDRLDARVRLLSGGQRQALTMLMATLAEPRVLLLDEHTAALDPKTAAHILDLTERIVAKKRLTTLMVTHNMHQAIRLGNRLIMMHRGRVILDVHGEEKRNLSVENLLQRFHSLRDGDGEAEVDAMSDKMLLA
ncbi:ATP-binding cassette domain-containing protein [Desulfovibrio sulfodismutans]|uniref:ATP-binding cassette domain-containing protein n=1 Tax=Desulfolutivibrio sulfodismutans TaxID=63561 RepID=A0A7K3NGQ8_9BACT|nr:ATP-binding cassette domain-containing protein [Desulfolutivibrio sulfodismutans]NDY55384.1 ATP-binding cassette domain-containing protein [Desulfolutivibrio sulfodismutans]QLA12240.1 ATP-binding cassette domain-containing protein [Desulfolutivibrio sulfodismutans DSM 3696]